MKLCDVNVFVRAHREDTDHHEFYRQWLESSLSAPETFLVCEFVLSAFVRIVTHPKVFRRPSPLDRALRFAGQIRSAPRGIAVMPGVRHWSIFASLSRRAEARGNLIPDAYLAALAIEAGAEWVSTDRDFARFEPDLRWRLLAPGS